MPAAGALLLIYPDAKTQVGLAATLVVCALIRQRALTGARHAADKT